MGTEMTSRERIRRALNHQEADRVAIQDAIWRTTEDRRHREGLPEGISPGAFFNFEMSRIGPDFTLRFPVEVLEETNEYRIHRNANGRVAKEHEGYLYHSDHSIPDNVSFQRYQRVIELVHQYGRYA